MSNSSSNTQFDDVPSELKSALLSLFENDETAALRWLDQRIPALSNKTPWDVIHNEPGKVNQVTRLVVGLEHGVHQ